MRYCLFGLLVAAACSSRGGNSQTASLQANAGLAPEPGAPVVTTHADGTVIDQTVTDPSGYAQLASEMGALITVEFVRANTTSIVTTPALDSDQELVITGPPPDQVPEVVGALSITAPPLAVTDGFEVSLGCATISVPALPAMVDIAAACLGHDINIDVLVRGFDLAGEDAPLVLQGYAATRTPLDGDVADFAIAAWDTDGTNVPVTLNDGVAPELSLTLWADGLPFPTPDITDHAVVWNGFSVDNSTVYAALGGSGNQQLTMFEAQGAPGAITVGSSDFLVAPPAGVALDPTTLAATWTAPGVGDATDLRVTWTADTTYVWDAVLPPDAAAVTLPEVMLPPPPTPSAIDVTFRAIDSSALQSFSDLDDAGLDVSDPVNPSYIVPRPASGEVRTVVEQGASGA